MESSDKCSPCAGDPKDPTGVGCSGANNEGCWDFFWVVFKVNDVVLFSGLIGGGDNRKTGSFTQTGVPVKAGDQVSIEVVTQTWEGDESVTFSNIRITGNAAPANLLPLVGAPFCQTTGNVSLTPSQNGLAGTWSGSTAIAGANFNTTAAGPGTYLLRFTPNANQCATPNTIEVNVSAVVPVPLDDLSFCQNRGTVTIPFPSSGVSGNWSGIGVNSNLYNTNTTVNSVDLRFTPTGGQCYTANTITAPVNSPISPTFSNLGPFCQNQIIQLPTTDDNGVVGGWTGTGMINNVTLNTGVGGTGVRNLRFTPGTGQQKLCAIAGDIPVTINPPVTLTVPPPGPFCVSNTPIQLNTTQDGQTGNWSGAGTVNNRLPINTVGNKNLIFTPTNSCFVPTNVTVVVGNSANITPLLSQIICGDSFTLPPITASTPLDGSQAYFTGTNGTGTRLVPGAVITGTQTLFAYYNSSDCSDEDTFTITFQSTPKLDSIRDTTTCDKYILPMIKGTNLTPNAAYYTKTRGAGKRYLPGQSIDSTQILFAYDSTATGCFDQDTFNVNIVPQTRLDTIVDVQVCSSYTLPALKGTGLSGTQAYYTAPNGGGTKYLPGQSITADLRLYAFDRVATCSSERAFSLDTISPPQIDSLSDTTACGSLQLPLITGKNLSPNVAYFGGRNGAGTRFLPGQTLSFSGNFFVFDQKAGCSAERLYRVSITPGPRIELGIKKPISCNGSKDGALDLKINNSLPPVTIRWNQASFNGIEDPANLAPGTYTVTVTDGTACAVIASATLIEPAKFALTCAVNKAVTQVGSADAEASVSISGGTARYKLSLNGPVIQLRDSLRAGTTILTGLSSGTYQVRVTDSLGCMDSCIFIITEPICSLSANIVTVKSILCNGDNSGVLTASVRNGRAPYNYLWSNGAGRISRDTLKNLGPGTYALILTDNLGCADTVQINLTQPPPMVVDCQVTSDVSTVGGRDGAAKLKYSGGTGAIALDWGGSQPGSVTASGRDSISLGSLPSGTYSPNFIDVNGCRNSCSFTIKEPVCNLQASLSTKAPACQGEANGQLIAVPTAGVAPFTFQWSNGGANNDTLSNLAAGTYQVTITDAINCQQVLDTVLQDPPALTFSCQIIRNVTTVKGKEGIARVSFSGGVAPYFIRVQGPVSSTRTEGNSGSVDLTGWSAGNYSVIISDINGCQQNCSFSLSEPICNLALQLQGINPLCNGAGNGQISVAVNGGKTPFKYDWSDNANDGQATARNLRAGIYTVVVSDSIGCVGIDTLVLTEPGALSLTCGTPVPTTTVGGQNGRINLRFSGGTAPYKLILSGAKRDSFLNLSVDSFTVNNLSKGDYRLTLVDKNGCTLQGCDFRINDPACNLVLTLTPTNNLCAGVSQGSIQSSVAGGIGPFTYDWSDNRFDGNPQARGLPSGNFQLIVTDAQLCRDTASVSIAEPVPLETICSVVNQPSTVGGSDGRARVVIRGGTGQRNIQLSGPSPGQMQQNSVDTFTFSNLAAGRYTVSVTDANGCTDTCSFILQNIICKLVGTAQGINPDCNGTATGSIQVAITGNNGVVTYAWNKPALNGATPTALAAETYTVTLTDAAACKDTLSIILLNPPQLTLAVAPASQPTPARPTGGSIALTYAGGTPAYRINWRPNGSDQSIGNTGAFTIPNLRAGAYTITLTDSNGCNAISQATLSEAPCNLSIDIAAARADCGSSHLNTTVSGGTGPFQYAWNATRFNGQANPRNATPGRYTITVTDAIGCSAKDSLVLVLDPSGLSVGLGLTNPLCPGDLGVLMLRNITGGQGPFTLTLNNSIQRFNNPPLTVRNLSMGTFALNITNASGCSFDTTITIQSSRSLSLELGPDTTLRRGAKLTFKPQLNFTPSQISWSPTSGLSSAQSLNAQAEPAFTTTYTLMLSDSAGCKVSDKIQILVAGQLEAYFPNAFSPNGDEVNDYFSGYGGGEIEALEYLRIFDRWGNLVFEGTNIPVDDPTKGWDGTSQGQPSPIGSYVFSSVVRMRNGSTYRKTGEVNLVR